MALKFFPRDSTSLFTFLREYNLALSFCTHPSLTRALGIAYRTPSHYVFAQQAGLYGDLFDVILPEVRDRRTESNLITVSLSHQILFIINVPPLSGRHGGGLLSAGGFPAMWGSRPPALSWIRPQRRQTRERLSVRLCLSLGQTWRLWHGQCKRFSLRLLSIVLGCIYLDFTRFTVVYKYQHSHNLHQVKAKGTRVPEVWYSSPYCTPEAEIARGNQDSWSGITNSVTEEEGKKNKPKVWVTVEPTTDSWALGILTYAMLTGSHPWTETASDCHSYLKYQEWFERSKGPNDELDVWAEPQSDLNEAEFGKDDSRPAAPQFASFTPLACSFFQRLLDPRPQHRGSPEDALSYLGGDWVLEKERLRLDQERKKSSGKGALRNVKEMEGRGER